MFVVVIVVYSRGWMPVEKITITTTAPPQTLHIRQFYQSNLLNHFHVKLNGIIIIKLTRSDTSLYCTDGWDLTSSPLGSHLKNRIITIMILQTVQHTQFSSYNYSVAITCTTALTSSYA